VDRTEKRDFVASLATVFAETSFVLVTQNNGLTATHVLNLRRRMKAAGATYKVAKNRLATLALDGTRFQGVKHPLAEMYVDVESAKSILYYAAWCLDEGDADAARAVSLAKAYASEAFARIGIDAVQLHGGVGFTWEYDPHLYLKRSKWARPAFGDSDFHYDRAIVLGEK